MVKLTCPGASYDFIDKLYASDELGYKSPEIVNRMLDMQFWVCRGCSADETMLAFDYCFGDLCKAGNASNFARMKAEIIRGTIRPGGRGRTSTAWPPPSPACSPIRTTRGGGR